jgi:hypothetical protein
MRTKGRQGKPVFTTTAFETDVSEREAGAIETRIHFRRDRFSRRLAATPVHSLETPQSPLPPSPMRRAHVEAFRMM